MVWIGSLVSESGSSSEWSALEATWNRGPGTSGVTLVKTWRQFFSVSLLSWRKLLTGRSLCWPRAGQFAPFCPVKSAGQFSVCCVPLSYEFVSSAVFFLSQLFVLSCFRSQLLGIVLQSVLSPPAFVFFIYLRIFICGLQRSQLQHAELPFFGA